MGALTTAELVTLIAAIIGQSGTLLKIVEDLHAQGAKPFDLLSAEHQQAVEAALQQLKTALLS